MLSKLHIQFDLRHAGPEACFAESVSALRLERTTQCREADRTDVATVESFRVVEDGVVPGLDGRGGGGLTGRSCVGPVAAGGR